MEPNVSVISDAISGNAKKLSPLIIAIILTFVLLAGLLLVILILPTTSDEKIFVSNISANQATLSWMTKTPARKWVLVTEKDNRFPRVFKDNKEGAILPLKAFSLHYVTLSNLDSNKSYKYKIYEGFKETASGIFSTSPKVAGATASKMVSGQVLAADQKTPVSGVIVYLQLFEGAKQSSLLSTTTDKEGKWQANILDAWTSNLKDNFKIASRTASLVVVESGAKGRYSSRFAITNKTQSLPNIILKGL